MAATTAALLLFSPANPAGAQSVTNDYDTDNDGLIEVDSLAKLNAIRFDPDGNGASSNAGYATASPAPPPAWAVSATPALRL